MIRRLHRIFLYVRLRYFEARVDPGRFDVEFNWKIDQVIVGQEAAES